MRPDNAQTTVQMGEALIRGFCKSGVSSVEQISASVRSFDRQRALSALGLRVYGNALDGGAADLAANSEIIFLGVSKTELGGTISLHAWSGFIPNLLYEVGFQGHLDCRCIQLLQDAAYSALCT